MSLHYRIMALIVRDLARKMVQILGFSAPVHFQGHLEEIDIAEVLLMTNLRRVEKFRDVGFATSRKYGERERKEMLCKI